jgi:hypothetical protein
MLKINAVNVTLTCYHPIMCVALLALIVMYHQIVHVQNNKLCPGSHPAKLGKPGGTRVAKISH